MSARDDQVLIEKLKSLPVPRKNYGHAANCSEYS
jgi:hypothetical protein